MDTSKPARRDREAPSKAPGKPSVAADPAADASEKRQRRLLDLLLTAPIFVVYHLGVVFLSVRNGFDPITDAMLSVLHRSLLAYLGITLAIAIALVVAVRLLGLGGKLKPLLLLARVGEAIGYAIAMCVIAQAVAAPTLGTKPTLNPFSALIMSFGAGFYEEVAFRVILFGGGAFLIKKLAGEGARAIGLTIAWALVAAIAFSAVHYVGSLSDPFRISSFVFRITCGLVLTAVYRLRGFATAVWTHALYDVGVMVF